MLCNTRSRTGVEWKGCGFLPTTYMFEHQREGALVPEPTNGSGVRRRNVLISCVQAPDIDSRFGRRCGGRGGVEHADGGGSAYTANELVRAMPCSLPEPSQHIPLGRATASSLRLPVARSITSIVVGAALADNQPAYRQSVMTACTGTTVQSRGTYPLRGGFYTRNGFRLRIHPRHWRRGTVRKSHESVSIRGGTVVQMQALYSPLISFRA
jgi:hypothetical protein